MFDNATSEWGRLVLKLPMQKQRVYGGRRLGRRCWCREWILHGRGMDVFIAFWSALCQLILLCIWKWKRNGIWCEDVGNRKVIHKDLRFQMQMCRQFDSSTSHYHYMVQKNISWLHINQMKLFYTAHDLSDEPIRPNTNNPQRRIASQWWHSDI